MPLREIYEAIYTRWLDDETLAALVGDRFFQGKTPSKTSRPYVWVRQRPGGNLVRATGGRSIETFLLTFEADAMSFESAVQLAGAITARFDLAAFDVAGQPIIQMDRTAPPFIEERAVGDWRLVIDYALTVEEGL